MSISEPWARTGTAGGNTATGPVSDDSTDGTDTDPDTPGTTPADNPNPEDNSDVTPVTFPETPIIGVAKDLVSSTNNGDGTFTNVSVASGVAGGVAGGVLVGGLGGAGGVAEAAEAAGLVDRGLAVGAGLAVQQVGRGLSRLAQAHRLQRQQTGDREAVVHLEQPHLVDGGTMDPRAVGQ